MLGAKFPEITYMIRKPDRSTKRNRRRSGATVVELALTIMPTFAIIFGFIDLGFALFTWNTLQNAVREGTRYAITMQRQNPSTGHIQSIKNVTAQWTLAMVNPNSTSSSGPAIPYVDVKFYRQTNLNVADTGPGSNSPGNVVEVSIRNYPYSWMFPFSGAFLGSTASQWYRTPGSTLTLNVYSADLLGGVGLGGVPPL